MTKSVSPDKFQKELKQMFGNLERRSEEDLNESIETGLKFGVKMWRKKAEEKGWGSGDSGHKYHKHGKSYHTGRYIRSIRSHMTSKGETPSGEIGAPKMPGLAHLLEFGHASPGGGSVRPKVHVAPAADVTFEYTQGDIEKRIEITLKEFGG